MERTSRHTSRTPTPGGRPSGSPTQGIVFMILAVLCFSSKDAAAKVLTESLHPLSVVFYQNAIALVLVLLWMLRVGARRVTGVHDVRMQALRAGLFAVNSVVFIYGLSLLPFSTSAMLSFVNPIFVTMLASVLLRERVGLERWLAVLVGFAGVLVITEPWSGLLSWAVLLPLLSAFLSALRDVMTRWMSAAETSESLLFYSLLAVLLVSGALTGFDLPALDARQAGVLALTGIGQVAAMVFLIEAVRRAEAGVVAPFRYANLIWIVLIDLVVWGTFPPANVIIGGVVIVAAMLYIFFRERA